MAELTDEEAVVAALGRDLTVAEEAQVDGLIEEAGDLLHGYLRVDYREQSPVPAAVGRVAARMVARSIEQAATVPAFGAESTTDQAGPFSRTLRFTAGSTSGSVWLDGKDKIKLRPFRVGGGLTTVSVESEFTGKFRTYD